MIPEPPETPLHRCPLATPLLIAALDHLIASLREELQHYGELLALLDQQRDWMAGARLDRLLESNAALRHQAEAIERARADRDRCRDAVADIVDEAPAVPFAVLIPRLPADYQPLLEALVLENDQLLLRIQQRAHQNHALLSRSATTMQPLLWDPPTLARADTTADRFRVPVIPPSPVEPQFEVVR